MYSHRGWDHSHEWYQSYHPRDGYRGESQCLQVGLTGMYLSFIEVSRDTENESDILNTPARKGWFAWLGLIDFVFQLSFEDTENWDILVPQHW